MEKLNLSQKLLKIQEEIGAIKKDQTNPHFKNTYYDINSLLEVVKPVLNRHKIVILQPLSGANMKTILMDTENGEIFESEVILPTNPDPQKVGAIVSYFRRYSIASMLALEAEDTDANDTAPKATQSNVVRNTSNPVEAVTAHIQPAPQQEQLCVKCGAIMKLVPAGVSKKNGKSYKAFYACPSKCLQF